MKFLNENILGDTSGESSIEAAIDTLPNLTSFGSAGSTTDIVAGDLTMYNAINNGNPTISLGSSANDRFEIKSLYNSGAQTIDSVDFTTYTTSVTSNDGRYRWFVDEIELARLLDGSFNVYGNITANDANAQLAALDTTASSATQGGKIRLTSNDGAAMADDHRLGVIEFRGAEDSSSTLSTGARIQAICRDAWDGSNNDADLEFYTTDGTTESKVLTLDADKLATFAGAVTVTGAITGNLTGNASGTAATVTGATQAAITTCADLSTVGTITTGVWQGTAIAHAYIGNDAIDGDNIADDAVNSEHYTDASIDTAHIADEAVTFAKTVGVTSNIFGGTIKLLPSDFAANIDGGNTKLGVGYTDTAGSAYGMKVGSSNTELFAFVSIPEGMKATHVDVFDKDDRALEVFEVQINATSLTSKGSGNCNTTLDITDVNATATNFLAIKITTTATTDKVFGGKVTIAAQ